MQTINHLKSELVDAILESNEYTQYKELERQIKSDPELNKAVNEYRRQNFELQYTQEDGDLFTINQELNERYADLRSDKLVNDYLMAEYALTRLIQDICMSIVSAVDFDMDFLQ